MRSIALRGIGACVVLLVLIAGAATLVRPSLGDGGALAMDFVAAAALLLTIHNYSRAMASYRIIASRKEKDAAQVVALLSAFVSTGMLNMRSRFDKTGEAHYRLAKAAIDLGEMELGRRCVAFLIRYRRGEWTEKARKLKWQT